MDMVSNYDVMNFFVPMLIVGIGVALLATGMFTSYFGAGPRFWPYGLNKVAKEGDKLIIFVVNNTSIIIVVDPEKMEDPKAIIRKINALL